MRFYASGDCVSGWLRAATFAAALMIGFAAQAAAQMPESFVYLRDIDPTIVQDIRYAGPDNFVGRPLAGYDAAECILRRAAAVALKEIQADLVASGHALKVYDCYRPERAVRAMAHWAKDGADGAAIRRFFPQLEKRNLFALGYIAARSRHSTGTAVDLTLVALPAVPAKPFDHLARYGDCTGPAALRAPDDGVDMGTGYDCFDARSATASKSIGDDQRRRRQFLVSAMARRGFRNYSREWWHFSYAAANAGVIYDFPIRPRVLQPR